MVDILTAEQIYSNYEKFTKFIHDQFNADRSEKLLKIVEDHEDIFVMAPASANISYHNCFPGGYIDHVLRVMQYSYNYYHYLSETLNSHVTDSFELEELLFAALNHDLGKIGFKDDPYYIPNDSTWHVKNQGKVYKYNPNLTYMAVPDRSIYILNHYGVNMTEREYIAIKTHDGLYDESNKSYLNDVTPDIKRETEIVLTLHHMDHIASIEEKKLYKQKLHEQVKRL